MYYIVVIYFLFLSNMETEKISTQMKKWILEYMILVIISSWEVYASDILSILTQNNLIVVEWTLYPLLSRLKNDKILSYLRVESVQWPPRKYYTLTPDWRELLWHMRSTRQNLQKAVSAIDSKL